MCILDVFFPLVWYYGRKIVQNLKADQRMKKKVSGESNSCQNIPVKNKNKNKDVNIMVALKETSGQWDSSSWDTECASLDQHFGIGTMHFKHYRPCFFSIISVGVCVFVVLWM